MKKYTMEEWQNLSAEEKEQYLESAKHTIGMYSVYDRIAGEYGGIIINNKGKGAVARDFFELINDKNQKTFYEHPADFELWYLGEFNQKTGEVDTTNKTIVVQGQQALETRKTDNN